jgi:hypothetical protein
MYAYNDEQVRTKVIPCHYRDKAITEKYGHLVFRKLQQLCCSAAETLLQRERVQAHRHSEV